MSVQPSLNNSNMVVAEIINEINSTQPSENMQSTRSTPIQRQQPPTRQVPVQQRATPFRRPNPPQQAQQAQQAQQEPPTNQDQRRPQNSTFFKTQEKMRNKKVRFKEEVEERVIQNESDSDYESDSESEDTSPIEEIVFTSKKNKRTKKDTPKVENVTTPKFLNKNEIQKNDLNETKGFYSKAINFFTNDTKEPLVVLVLVFAISMPIVNKLLARFIPFLMKHGEGSMFVVGAKALLVAIVFFSVKKLLL